MSSENSDNKNKNTLKNISRKDRKKLKYLSKNKNSQSLSVAKKILAEEKFQHNLLQERTDKNLKPGFFWYFFRTVVIVIAVLVLMISFIIMAVFIIWGRDLPDVRDLKNNNFAETSVILDRNGNILYKVFGEENRKYVPLSKINKKLIEATIATEDKNFYAHFGFDPLSIVRAQLRNIQDENSLQGASTITQQLAKNLYLSPERTFDRKIKELILALEIESYFSKDEILELYLNKIPYGSNAYGIEAAANTFFGKNSNDLTTVEAAIIAALPKAPSKYSPYRENKNELLGYCQTESCSSPEDPNYVWGRKDLVLQRMLEDGKISKEEFLEAWKEGFNVIFNDPKHSIKAPHFVLYVRDYLEQKYGKEFVEKGGLTITTTLDFNLQTNAENIIAEKYESNVKKYGANNAALVALDPRTGQILAMVGSADYWDLQIEGQVNMITALRQPGSSFKPLVYAAAIENAGIGSGTNLPDYRTRFEKDYIPVNSDNNYRGKMSVRRALSNSRNIPAIKAWYLAGGEEKVLEFIDKLGVKSLKKFKDLYNSESGRHWDFKYGPSMAIGAGEMQILELAGAYSVFANSGIFNPINPLLEVTDRDGKVIEKLEDHSEQVMKPETAYIINSILSDILARPAGSWRNILTITGQNLAAKTGTSNKLIGKVRYPNNLVTVGYTPTILAATWVGNTDGKQVSMRAWGEFTAAPINKAFLETVLKDQPLVPFEIPEGITKVGNEFYPPNWDKKRNYDSTFKPLEKKICTPEEKIKDPAICFNDEELAAQGFIGAEIPLNPGNTAPVAAPGSADPVAAPLAIPAPTPPAASNS